MVWFTKDIDEISVIGVPNEEYGQIIGACVVLKTVNYDSF